MTKSETSMFASFPWMPASFGTFPDFTAAGFDPASALAAFQQNNQAWSEAMATVLKSFQAIAIEQMNLAKGTISSSAEEIQKMARENLDQHTGFAACQEAFKTAQDYGAFVLNANMKAFEMLCSQMTSMLGETGKVAAETAALESETAKTLDGVAKDTWRNFEKAQETSAKAWEMLQKRLAEGVQEWNAGAKAWVPGADIPNAVKESYERLAADSGGLFDVIQKSNSNALSLMQKRFSTAVDEMSAHFPAMAPGKGMEKLEAAAHAYERAAHTISDALAKANQEAMEALQAWSAEAMKGGGQPGDQRAA